MCFGWLYAAGGLGGRQWLLRMSRWQRVVRHREGGACSIGLLLVLNYKILNKKEYIHWNSSVPLRICNRIRQDEIAAARYLPS